MDDARGNSTNSSNNNKRKQKQIQILDRVELEKDEFTEHKTIKHALIDFVVEAERLQTYYRAQMKEMIRTVALKIESELIRLGKSDLISHISEELIRIIKHVGLRWNAIYLRRCLDERFKNPVNRANALARKKYPGLPEDSGRDVKQLEAALQHDNKAKGWGEEYVVKQNLQLVKSFKSNEEGRAFTTGFQRLWKWEIDEKQRSGTIILTIPVNIRARPKEQDATVEMDMEAFNRIANPQSTQEQKKTKTKSKQPESKQRNCRNGREDASRYLVVIFLII